MSKIRTIKDYYFCENYDDADKYDYLYRERLKLPFDFSLQCITGTDIKKIKELYYNAKQIVSIEQNCEFDEICFDYDNYDYSDRLKLIDNQLCNCYTLSDADELILFFYFPECLISVDEQQSFVYDSLMIAKDALSDKFKHINFVIITQSVIILSDCFPGNVLCVNKTEHQDNEANEDSTFCANLYDIYSHFGIMSFNGKCGSEILHSISKQIGDKENGTVFNDSLDFIGDTLVRGMYKKANNNLINKNEQ